MPLLNQCVLYSSHIFQVHYHHETNWHYMQYFQFHDSLSLSHRSNIFRMIVNCANLFDTHFTTDVCITFLFVCISIVVHVRACDHALNNAYFHILPFILRRALNAFNSIAFRSFALDVWNLRDWKLVCHSLRLIRSPPSFLGSNAPHFLLVLCRMNFRPFSLWLLS